MALFSNLIVPCAAIGLAHFILQAWPRLFNPFFGVDCWRHMLAADYIRRHRKLPITSMPNYLFVGVFDYPPLVAILLAIFPHRLRLILQAVAAPLIESLHGVVVFFLVHCWTGRSDAAMAAQILFALVPITALENSQLNARGLGSLFLSIVLLGASHASQGGSGTWLWLAAAAVAGTLIHLTHKMASQTLVLFSILAIPLVAYLPGVMLAGPFSLGLTFILFPALYRRIAQGQFAVLRYYRRTLAPGQAPSNSVESQTFIGRLVAFAKRNPLITIAGADPWQAPIALAIIVTGPAALCRLEPGVVWLLLFWLGALYLLIVGTTVIRPLRFLGDGPRYSYYLAFPVAVLGGVVISHLFSLQTRWREPILIAFLLTGALIVLQIVIIQWKGVVRDRERSYRGDVKRIGELLKQHRSPRVAVFPLCTAEVVAFFSGAQVLSTDSALAHAVNEDFRDFNPRLLKPLPYFLEKFSITHCVVQTTESSAMLNMGGLFMREFNGKNFVLWARQPESHGAL